MEITSTDAKILNALQEDARVGLEALAEMTGLSTATVQRRLKKMREDGTIMQDVVLVDPAKVGHGMTMVVMVELERERLDRIDQFTRRVTADPNVQQCYYITGEADFCLVCTARDIEDFERLTHRLFFDDANVRRFRTSVVMSRKKVGLSVPVVAE